MTSPFDVLGIDPGADEEEVIRAYRDRVKDAHPDHGGTPREFRAVRRAYERIQSGDVDFEPSSTEHVTEPDRPERPQVEYLNYDVLAEHGWDVGDDDLFEKAAAANLDSVDHGQFVVDPDDSLLEAAERCGLPWPFACRGGACTNCAVVVVEGEIPPPTDHILPPELIERGVRLTCITRPGTSELKVLYNVKHLPGLDELRLPASRFDQTRVTE